MSRSRSVTIGCDKPDCTAQITGEDGRTVQLEAERTGWELGDPMHGTPDLCHQHAWHDGDPPDPSP